MELLEQSVQSVINKERIGSPVFLRCILNIVREDISLLQPAAELIGLSNAWIPSQVETVYAQGEVYGPQITVMLQYTDGQMAMLAINRVSTETAIDLMLVGNRGVIYHETPIGRHFLSGMQPIMRGEGELSEAISRSLASGRPAIVEG